MADLKASDLPSTAYSWAYYEVVFGAAVRDCKSLRMPLLLHRATDALWSVGPSRALDCIRGNVIYSAWAFCGVSLWSIACTRRVVGGVRRIALPCVERA